MPHRPRRLIAGFLLAIALCVVSIPVDSASATTDGQDRVRELVNRTRNRHGLRSLTMDRVSADRAQNWARALARCRCLKHRAGPYGAPAGWYAAAENVGRGWSHIQVHNAFLGSSGHRKNILTARFTHIGTGSVKAPNGELFVVHAFADRTP